MKLTYPIFLALLMYSAAADAQWQKPVSLTHNQETRAADANNVQPQNIFQDSIKGDAGKFISFVNAKNSCGSGLKGIGVTNSSDKLIEAKIELTTAYNGHVSKKIINIDALSPNEVNSIGCAGCTDNTQFKTCTTYRIVSANFKP